MIHLKGPELQPKQVDVANNIEPNFLSSNSYRKGSNPPFAKADTAAGVLKFGCIINDVKGE